MQNQVYTNPGSSDNISRIDRVGCGEDNEEISKEIVKIERALICWKCHV